MGNARIGGDLTVFANQFNDIYQMRVLTNTMYQVYDPFVKLASFDMRKNTFNDIEGSVAIHGMSSHPIESC